MKTEFVNRSAYFSSEDFAYSTIVGHVEFFSIITLFYHFRIDYVLWAVVKSKSTAWYIPACWFFTYLFLLE